MKFPQSRILVFAKEPEPGSAKTRLAPLLGYQGAADLHARFVHSTLNRVCRARLSPVELWCSPSVDTVFFRDCRERFDIILRQQSTGDLGQRMHQAISAALSRSRSVVLIGADCPGLCATDLAEAFRVLDRGTGAVLGPAQDGGYYLIGLTDADPQLFDAFDWGSDSVFAETVKRLEDRNMGYHCLPVREDVDTPEDYYRAGLGESIP